MSRFRLILNSSAFGEQGNEWLNVFYYESPAGGTSASDLANVFEANVLLRISAVTVARTVFNYIQVDDLDDATNFTIRIPQNHTIGLVPETSHLPGFVAWSFQYLRATHAVRHGWKRFSMLDETQLDNGAAAANQVANLDALATALGQSLTGFPFGWEPRIARRPPKGGTLDQTILFPIIEVVYRGVTTQTTRKR